MYILMDKGCMYYACMISCMLILQVSGLPIDYNIHIIIYVCISYNTDKSALPDIYTRRPRAGVYLSGKAFYN